MIVHNKYMTYNKFWPKKIPIKVLRFFFIVKLTPLSEKCKLIEYLHLELVTSVKALPIPSLLVTLLDFKSKKSNSVASLLPSLIVTILHSSSSASPEHLLLLPDSSCQSTEIKVPCLPVEPFWPGVSIYLKN